MIPMKITGFLCALAIATCACGQTPREMLQRNVGTNTVQGSLYSTPFQVATIAALKAVSVANVPNGTQVYVVGYYTTGDGGEGHFTYNSSSSATPDNGAVISPNSGSGRWLRSHASPLNVRWWGAKGDGVTDDATALQGALNYAASVGGEVWLPLGTYLVGSTLSVPGYVSFRGSGDKSIIKASSGLTTNVLSVDSGSGFGNRGGIISNFLIDSDGHAAIGLYVGLAVQRHFERITVHNSNTAGVVVDATQNCSFIGIDMADNEGAMLLLNGAGNNYFLRCEFDTSNSFHLTVLTDSNYPGYVWNLFSRIPQENTFERCIFERHTSSDAVYVNLTNSKDNIFSNCDFGGMSGAAHVVVASGSSLNRLRNCYFNGGATGTIAIEQRGFGTVIENCIFESFAAGAEVVQTYNRTFLYNLHFAVSTYTVANKSGDAGNHIRWTDGTIYSGSESPPTSGLYPGKFYYNDTDEWYARGRTVTSQLLTGAQKDKAATGAAGTSHGTTLQLARGAWLVSVSARNADSNNTRTGTYMAYAVDASVNDVATVAQIGSDVVSGTQVTVLTVTIDATGLLDVAVTTGSSQTVTITISARKLGGM